MTAAELNTTPTIDPTIADADQPATDIVGAITSRYSVRAFTDQPVSREQITGLLDVARYAPSATNSQPWHVHVLEGAALTALSDAILARFNGEVEWEAKPDYDYYPEEWVEPYLARRRACGWGLYGALGIGKGDRDKMHAQHGRNFTFFDAPVGMMFTLDRRMRLGAWIDMGMFMQNIMVAARGVGLHTCPQAAFADYAPVIREQLDVPDEQIVVCGMSIGYRRDDVAENRWRTSREPTTSFVSWHGQGKST